MKKAFVQTKYLTKVRHKSTSKFSKQNRNLASAATYWKLTMLQRRYTSIAEESESENRTAGGKNSGEANFVTAKTSKQTLNSIRIEGCRLTRQAEHSGIQVKRR